MAKKPKVKLSFRPDGFVDNVGTINKWYTTWITGFAILVNGLQAGWLVFYGDPIMPPTVYSFVNVVLLALNQFANTIKQAIKAG